MKLNLAWGILHMSAHVIDLLTTASHVVHLRCPLLWFCSFPLWSSPVLKSPGLSFLEALDHILGDDPHPRPDFPFCCCPTTSRCFRWDMSRSTAFAASHLCPVRTWTWAFWTDGSDESFSSKMSFTFSHLWPRFQRSFRVVLPNITEMERHWGRPNHFRMYWLAFRTSFWAMERLTSQDLVFSGQKTGRSYLGHQQAGNKQRQPRVCRTGWLSKAFQGSVLVGPLAARSSHCELSRRWFCFRCLSYGQTEGLGWLYPSPGPW